ncbi:MAG: EAL domain-containing protein [Kineosporiaceae bacterium]|nr:EAL domain-containing protein [Kineosporiaceae bacterium]MBK7624908.1 EAL domain-containing protein [Kineosporiaceae bacterium]MBK8076713.1 EAL domain-containing protein [Kineosporiaceae bacterium]
MNTTPDEPVDPLGEPRWEDEVARLLRRPESLRCVFQPVVDLHTGDCAGYEALTRVADWPARSPQPWFTAAARTGLAGQLEAASLTNAFKGRADLGAEQFLAVNVAAPHLDEDVVLEVLRSQPDLTGVVIELDWPDGVPFDYEGNAAVAALRVAGLRVACDVAEAGRAELDRLHQVRPDLVKLDAQLVKGAHEDPVRDRLIRLVVTMAQGMGAVVQAEGVESLDDARHLQAVGVRLAQGWLFGRARPSFLSPAAEVSTWLRTSWEDTISRTRAGRLARPVQPGDEWAADVDDEGRLVALIDAEGATQPASRLLRLRSSQDLRSAALRVLASDAERRALGVVVITDDDGRFLGLSEVDAVMREVLAEIR